MNIEKLKRAEAQFLSKYPDGFYDIGLAQIVKTHNKANLTEFAQTHFGPECGSHVEQTIANLIKCVSRSSMMSMFDKPKFRDFCQRLDLAQKGFLVDSVIELLHGNQQAGFDGFKDLLLQEKIARWPIMTIILAYYAPSKEVFIKPTTTKGILSFLEIETVVYKPRPSWEFYQDYRAIINELKTKVETSLSTSNAAFTGFLMMEVQH